MSLDIDSLSEALHPTITKAIEVMAKKMIARNVEPPSKALAKGIIRKSIKASEVADIFLAGMPESFPQIIGVVNFVMNDKQVAIAKLDTDQARKLIAKEAVSHINKLEGVDNEIVYWLDAYWPTIADVLVD
jgi:hypothetical protein